MKMKISTIAHLPPELAQAWLQHLRDFDTAHPGCHFEVMADAPDMGISDMIEMVSIHPDLDFTLILERKKPDGEP